MCAQPHSCGHRGGGIPSSPSLPAVEALSSTPTLPTEEALGDSSPKGAAAAPRRAAKGSKVAKEVDMWPWLAAPGLLLQEAECC